MFASLQRSRYITSSFHGWVRSI